MRYAVSRTSSRAWSDQTQVAAGMQHDFETVPLACLDNVPGLQSVADRDFSGRPLPAGKQKLFSLDIPDGAGLKVRDVSGGVRR